MKICSACGYPMENNEAFCTECGTQYQENHFRWHNVEEAVYRERFGVLPQLNFVNQDGFDLIKAPPVQYSKIANSGLNDIKAITKQSMSTAKDTLKNIFKGIVGTFEIIAGNAGKGISDLITGSAGVVINPAMKAKERKDVDNDIKMFENVFWKERYFAMTFKPVPIQPGEEYIVQIDDERFNGFYVNQNGVYFEGLIANNGNPIKGISIYPDGTRFVGTFNGPDADEGLALYEDGSYYRGRFVNNMRHGEDGVYISDSTYYFGEWQNNSANGFGTCKNGDGEIYSGEWIDGKPAK